MVSLVIISQCHWIVDIFRPLVSENHLMLKQCPYITSWHNYLFGMIRHPLIPVTDITIASGESCRQSSNDMSTVFIEILLSYNCFLYDDDYVNVHCLCS